MSSESQSGSLNVVATPIGNLSDLSERTAETLQAVDLILCEDTRVTRKLLNHLNIEKTTLSYREENEKQLAPQMAERIANGESIALVCDAGTPTLSDPGFRLVRECQKLHLPVIPIPGPNAAITALSASGLPTNGYLFAGFLPPKKSARQAFLKKYEDFEYTLIFYESCHRIEKFIDDIETTLGADRTICIAKELTKRYERIMTGTLTELAEPFKLMSKKGEFVVLIAPKTFTL